MSLRYALLGLLSKQEATGYELTQRFKESMIHFWYAHHTQIYRELSKMEKEGLVGYRVVHQEEHPNKKIYTLQDEGFKDLLGWLLESEMDPPKLKDSRLLKVSLFHMIPRNQAIKFLEKSRKDHEAIMHDIQRWKESYFPEDKYHPNKVGEYLTVEFGIRAMKTWVEWCDWAIGVLRKAEDFRDEENES